MTDEQEFEHFLDGIVLECDAYAEGPDLTEDDLETIAIHAEGSEKCSQCASRLPGIHGYIGAQERNYLTDEWVLTAAASLGWDRRTLARWACSKAGCFAIEANPHSQAEMQAEMARTLAWLDA